MVRDRAYCKPARKMFRSSLSIQSDTSKDTVMERLLETVSFEASDKSGSHVQINAGYVDEHLAELSKDEDLSRYIL